VCFIAEAWGPLCRAFLDITAHWLSLNSDGLIERHSDALAAKRFTGDAQLLIHTYFLFIFT